MKKVKFKGASLGTSSILIIIVTLTLICFAGLSLASASADYKLCQKLADRTTLYYGATSEAYIKLSIMQEEIDEGKTVNINIPINEYQEFQLEAASCDTSLVETPDHYHLNKFCLVTINEPVLDDSLSLLSGLPSN